MDWAYRINLNNAIGFIEITPNQNREDAESNHFFSWKFQKYIEFHNQTNSVLSRFLKAAEPEEGCCVLIGKKNSSTKGLKRNKGKIIVKFIEPIEPGLSRDKFEKKLEAVIERETKILVESAIN